MQLKYGNLAEWVDRWQTEIVEWVQGWTHIHDEDVKCICLKIIALLWKVPQINWSMYWWLKQSYGIFLRILCDNIVVSLMHYIINVSYLFLIIDSSSCYTARVG
jgi:hypothetical protein